MSGPAQIVPVVPASSGKVRLGSPHIFTDFFLIWMSDFKVKGVWLLCFIGVGITRTPESRIDDWARLMRKSVMGIDLGFVNFGRGRSDKYTTSESEFDTASEAEPQSESKSEGVHRSRVLRRIDGPVRIVVAKVFMS